MLCNFVMKWIFLAKAKNFVYRVGESNCVMKALLTYFTALMALVFFVPSTNAQQATSNPRMKVKVTLSKMDTYMRYSPMVQITDAPKQLPKAKRWAEFEVPFKVDAVPAPKSGYIDSLKFRFYIAVINPDRSRQYLKIFKEVSFVNVPVNELTYATVYLSPSSVRRICGSDGGKTMRWMKYWGVTVEYNGKEEAILSSETGKKAKWWDISSPNIVDTNYYPLLNRDETPFAPFWYDRYPEVLIPNQNKSSAPIQTTPFGSTADPEAN